MDVARTKLRASRSALGACRYHRRRRRSPAVRERDAVGLGHAERRALQPRRAARGPRGGRAPVPVALRHRGAAASLRAVRAFVPGAAAGDVRPRGVGRRSAPCGHRTGSPGDQAALLGGSRRPPDLRLRAQELARKRADRAAARLRRRRRLPDVRLLQRSRYAVRGRVQGAAGTPHRGRRVRREPGAVLGLSGAAIHRWLRARVRRGSDRAARGVGADAPDGGRAPRSDAQRRTRLVAHRRAHGAEHDASP